MTGGAGSLAVAEGVNLLLGRKTKARRAGGTRSLWTGAPLAARAHPEYPGRSSHADATARLKAIARKSPQVLVKIPAKGRKSAKSLARHFSYLARNGEETLVDQDGRLFSSADELRDLRWAWMHAGPYLAESGARNEAFHIIFSMREGTDERAVFGAVRATAELEFGGHQWVMVQHHDEPQVHVHVCVKTESFDGRRLNPRKADLQRWREGFAYELRERGVEAEATRRASRLQREKVRRPWGVAQMESRGVSSRPMPASIDPDRMAGWQRVEGEASSHSVRIIRALSDSPSESDRRLAVQFSEAVRAEQQRNKASDRKRMERPRRGEPER